jgi:histidyl-tRNA synthetase
MNNIQTLKGFRDFLPLEARKRAFVINELKKIFEDYGFEPLETPALEYEEILMGKYGEEGNKLMYRFTDNGGRKVALRYEQTVPLARVVAQYRNDLPRIFKRYQIQPVWRGENTQRGRYREFLQCDIDTVGTDDTFADAEIIDCSIRCLTELGIPDIQVWINDREILNQLSKEEVVALDKLDKIGPDNVAKEWEKLGRKNAKQLLDKFTPEQCKPTQRLVEIMNILKLKGLEKMVKFTPNLARGLDYYTSTIFEIRTQKYPGLSIAGGGRYDNLVGMFSRENIPAVGLAFGFDRIMEIMNDLNSKIQDVRNSTEILVTISGPESAEESLRQSLKLWGEKKRVELYLNRRDSIEKQVKYAKIKGIPQMAVQVNGEWQLKKTPNF